MQPRPKLTILIRYNADQELIRLAYYRLMQLKAVRDYDADMVAAYEDSIKFSVYAIKLLEK